ncbi:MAG: hypothetical protein WEK74_06205, partial [Hydrogenophaga sp.]
TSTPTAPKVRLMDNLGSSPFFVSHHQPPPNLSPLQYLSMFAAQAFPLNSTTPAAPAGVAARAISITTTTTIKG